MIRRPPGASRTDTIFPDTRRCRSDWTVPSAFIVIRTLTAGTSIAAGSTFQHGRIASRTAFSSPGARRDGVSDWVVGRAACCWALACVRSEEHTSELQSLMRLSYAVFCLTKDI